jgi:DNA (cytosine-5)-methyltransferase 1
VFANQLEVKDHMSDIPLLSFFSGGGFLDIGFELGGLDVVWSNEVVEAYADMYLSGLTSWRLATGSIHAGREVLINRSSIEKLNSRNILKEAFGIQYPGFFGVIGGPPCQDFSQAGRDLGVGGDRGRWTQVFIDLICELRPSFFVMENVPGLQRKKHRGYFNEIIQQLEESELGYFTSAKILSALELGVPQDRDRLFVGGFRKDLFLEKGKGEAVLLLGQNGGWFPWPEPKYQGAKDYKWPGTDPFGSETVAIPEDVPLELTVNELVQDDASELPNGKEGFVPYSKKFKQIAEGDVSGKSFKRLHRYRYSPTVWYGNNEVHLHPWKPRRLTVREALRIQTVPDEYVLPSDYSLTAKFKVISNGVPSMMAKAIAEQLKAYIHREVLS